MIKSTFHTSTGGFPATARLRSCRLLLTAALAEVNVAVEAWHRWSAEFGLDRLDGEGYWILPLLHRNLSRARLDYPHRPILAGVCKQTLVRNALLRPQLHELLGRLQQQICDPLPGPVTSLVLTGEGETIPLDPCELLVRAGDLQAADSALRSQGWQPWMPLPPAGLRPLMASARYRHPKAGDIILRWRPFGLDCPVEQDPGVWQRAAWHNLDGRTIKLADPVDRLLMASHMSSLIKTCVTMNRLASQVSPQEVRTRARKLGLGRWWHRVYGCSPATLIAGVPDQLMHGHLDPEFAPLPDAAISLPRLAVRHWKRYRGCGWPSRPFSFVRYLVQYYRYIWQSNGTMEFLSSAIQRTLGRG